MYSDTFVAFSEVYGSVADGLLIPAFSPLAHVWFGKIIKGESFLVDNFIV